MPWFLVAICCLLGGTMAVGQSKKSAKQAESLEKARRERKGRRCRTS